MMLAIANVKIWNNKVGVVLWDEMSNVGLFEFDKNFPKLGLNLSPILFPLSNFDSGKRVFSFLDLNFETFKGLPGLLADSIPDGFGNNLMDALLAQEEINIQKYTPVDKLCFIGSRAMGALEFEAINSASAEPSNKIDFDSVFKYAKEVADNLISNKNFNTSDKGFFDILQTGISAGGSKAKAVIGYNDLTREFQLGTIDGLNDFDYWLIKFDFGSNSHLSEINGVGKLEYAYYLMALDCGINLAESKLFEENSRCHFMTKRFDRQKNQKIHMQTLCGLAHFDCNQIGANSYEQAFQIMRQMKLPHADSEQLFRRMVFNVMSRNQNDHTKKISFLMFPNGKWQLAPAYGITYTYNPDDIKLKSHQMSINGKRDNILLEDLLAIAKNISIKKPKLIIDKCNEILFNWVDYAKKVGIDSYQTRQIEREIIIYNL